MLTAAKALTLGLVSLALPALAAPPAADFVYRIDGAASVSALRVAGASAQWSPTLDDGMAIEAVAEKLPAIKNGAVHLVSSPAPPRRPWSSLRNPAWHPTGQGAANSYFRWTMHPSS